MIDILLGPCSLHFLIVWCFNSGISLTANLSVAIRDRHWYWPPARSYEMLAIQRTTAHIPFSSLPDSIPWLPSGSSQFNLVLLGIV